MLTGRAAAGNTLAIRGRAFVAECPVAWIPGRRTAPHKNRAEAPLVATGSGLVAIRSSENSLAWWRTCR
jgi:hypothetical protein